MQGYIAFDLEIHKVIPKEETDWKQYRPYGISCASTFDGIDLNVYHSEHGIDDGSYMSVEEVRQLVQYLSDCQNSGVSILTYNGLAFDFDVLAEESHELSICSKLALNHYDPGFQIFAMKGYMPSLNTLAHAFGLQGKTENMNGALAPVMWRSQEGDDLLVEQMGGVWIDPRENRIKTLEYVGQDSITTYQVAQTILEKRNVKWTSKSGKPVYVPMLELRTVQDCLNIHEPDTSWMSKPKTRADMMSWMGVK